MIYLRKTDFAFLDISLPFFTTFPCSTIFSIVLNCSCLGLWIVSLFLKFLMCFGFICCAGLLFLMFQKADARNMMPHWRNFQSWSKLLINFIQFLELVFVNKFEFSIMTLNIDIYFVFIVFFIVFFAFDQYYYIKLYQLYFNNNGNKYFYYIIIINYKKMTFNAYTYSYKMLMNNI